MSSADDQNVPPTVTQTLVSDVTLTAIHSVTYAAGTILFREREPDNRLYVILSGQIALLSGLDTADERVIELRGSGEILGELSYFNPNHPHRFSTRAQVDAEVLELNRTDLDVVLRREPLLAYELLRVAGRHLHRSHRRAMAAMQQKNAELAEAYAALEAAQARLVQQERVEHELRLAREIQERMLPTVMPEVAGIDLGVRSIPAYEVGGDFFDVFVLDDGALGIAIGDVVGKGIPAALYMAQTRTLIRAEAIRAASPETVLRRVNLALQALNRGDMFVTVLYARVQAATRTVVMARAGHEYPMLCARDGTELPGPRAVGQPLGMLEDPVLDVQARTLLPGDTLVLYTDGVTDTVNPEGAFFDRAGLQEAVQSASATAAQELCDHIVQQVAAFQETAPQADDLTLVVVQAY